MLETFLIYLTLCKFISTGYGLPSTVELARCYLSDRISYQRETELSGTELRENVGISKFSEKIYSLSIRSNITHNFRCKNTCRIPLTGIKTLLRTNYRVLDRDFSVPKNKIVWEGISENINVKGAISNLSGSQTFIENMMINGKKSIGWKIQSGIGYSNEYPSSQLQPSTIFSSINTSAQLLQLTVASFPQRSSEICYGDGCESRNNSVIVVYYPSSDKNKNFDNIVGGTIFLITISGCIAYICVFRNDT